MMMHPLIGAFFGVRDYRGLKVWERSHALAVQIRRACRGWSRSEYSALRSQMIRAAESIVFNIVEGCGAESQREFARFLEISLKSAAELDAQIQLARDYGVLPPREWHALSGEITELRKMLFGLRAKVLASAHAVPPRAK